ncbi:MAG TPA: SPOR domain-containing protein [Gallionellaceae bacterium]
MAKLDSEDELKRQMRRRLVGAVALVTALIVILPMLLENTPDPRTGSLELRIPDKDRAGAFTSQMVVAESAPEITVEPSAAMPQEVVVPPASVPASAVSTVPAKPVKPESVQSALAKPEPAHKPARPERKTAEHKPTEHKAEERKPGFAVQVGAYSHAATAKELLEKLRKQGWHAYTAKAGETVRVRVGPYSSRGAAEQALHKLEAQGMQPAIVGEP